MTEYIKDATGVEISTKPLITYNLHVIGHMAYQIKAHSIYSHENYYSFYIDVLVDSQKKQLEIARYPIQTTVVKSIVYDKL